jgi:exosortase A
MTAVLPIDKAKPLTAPGWRAHLLALGCAAAAILILLRSDAAHMARIWAASSTYNHCFLILPIIGWLVWQRLPELRQLAPSGWAPGLGLVASGALVWLLGDAGEFAMARHLGLVLMLQGTVAACLGKAVARGLLFPLCYALFLVPAGDELVPLMQTVTAKICMGLLWLAGVPARLDGVFITIPGGYFKVAEACSGVKVLVAMVAYGALVANVCFRSPARRAAIVALSVALPILANGVRAWGTIMISHFVDAKFAVGFDHVFYGWLFFAIVMALVMAIGWPFFDRAAADPWFDPQRLQAGQEAESGRRAAMIAGACVAIAALPLAWSGAAAAPVPAPPPIALPQVPGWTAATSIPTRPWNAHFAGADRIATAHYRDSSGRIVDLAIAVFARQSEGRKIVGYGQGAVDPGGDWAWTSDSAPAAGGRAERILSHGTAREAVTFYRIGGTLTGSPARVKLETMKDRLLGGSGRAAAILVSAEEGAGGRQAIDAFLEALGPPERLADRAAGLPGR